ncbi:unnamed protein product, partial [Acidithrix sp. C25]
VDATITVAFVRLGCPGAKWLLLSFHVIGVLSDCGLYSALSNGRFVVDLEQNIT